MAKIKKGIDDFVSGFHIEELANHLSYLIREYYQNQIVAHTEARPDLGVDWWTAEYLADHIEEIANKLLEECDNLRAYANSGERRPLEDWQNAFNKSTKKSKSLKKNYDDDISGLIEDFIIEFDESEYGQNLYDNDFNKYSIMMNLLTDAQIYAGEGDYYDAKDLLEDFRDKSDGEMDVSKLETALYFIGQVYEASAKKSKMKKSSSFNDWLRAKPLANLPYGVQVVNIENGWNNDERVITFRITDDRTTTAEDDERFDRLIDNLYGWCDSYHGKGMASSGFGDAIDEKTFTWGVRDDRQYANYDEIDGEDSTDYGAWSTKKSIPKANMSFEDNVNKMRTHNYARTGNINTVMKKRD